MRYIKGEKLLRNGDKLGFLANEFSCIEERKEYYAMDYLWAHRPNDRQRQNIRKSLHLILIPLLRRLK
jgi:hypothetical protein